MFFLGLPLHCPSRFFSQRIINLIAGIRRSTVKALDVLDSGLAFREGTDARLYFFGLLS
jgi:hypothetical protein